MSSKISTKTEFKLGIGNISKDFTNGFFYNIYTHRNPSRNKSHVQKYIFWVRAIICILYHINYTRQINLQIFLLLNLDHVF